MPKRTRTHSRLALEASRLLGLQIRQARIERRWTTSELAERGGISRATLQKVEAGNPTVAGGIMFDVATLVGVPLFFEDRSRLVAEINRGVDRIALLPEKVRPRKAELDDDF